MCTPDVAQHPRSLHPKRITSSPFLEEQREIRHVSSPSFRVLQHEHHEEPRKNRGRQVFEKAPRHQVPHEDAGQMPLAQRPDREEKRRANVKKLVEEMKHFCSVLFDFEWINQPPSMGVQNRRPVCNSLCRRFLLYCDTTVSHGSFLWD